MSFALYAVAAVLFALLFVPWLMLLSTSLVTGASIFSSLPVFATKRAQDRLRPETNEEKAARKDVLVVEGLEDDAELEGEVQSALAKVLTLTPEEMGAHACACVKQGGDAYVGVVRVFGRRGHYLLHETGKTKKKVGLRMVRDLRVQDGRFPARLAKRWEAHPDCQAVDCPLRGRRREAEAA